MCQRCLCALLHVTHLRPARSFYLHQQDAALCCTVINSQTMDIRKWFKHTTSNKSDNDGETETRSQREVNLAAGEQAAASSGCSLPPEPLPPQPLPSPQDPEQAPGPSKAPPPDDLGKEEPLQVRSQKYPSGVTHRAQTG